MTCPSSTRNNINGFISSEIYSLIQRWASEKENLSRVVIWSWKRWPGIVTTTSKFLHISWQKNAAYSNILNPIFINPGRKYRTNFLFLFRKKSSKMDFVKMLLGLAASHLGGLALCALYAGTWRKFINRAIKQVHLSISNPFFLFCNSLFIFVAQCWASGLFSQWKARQR